MDAVDTPELRALCEAGAVKKVEVTRTPEGFQVCINGSLALHTQRGQPKSFKSCATLIGYLERTGISRFSIQL